MKSFLIAMAVALSFAAPAVGQDKSAEVNKPPQPAKKQQKKSSDGKTKRKSATIAPAKDAKNAKDAKKAAQHKKPLEQPPSAASAQSKGVIVQPEGSGDGSGPRKAPLRFNPKPEK